MIGVAAVGAVEDINCWSSTPYFFFNQGREAGLFTDPWNLELDQFKFPRKIWNIFNLLRLNKPGGYQYSSDFLDKAEASIPAHFFSKTIISFNQLFPRAETVNRAGGKIIYYIDMTLVDLFSDLSYGVSVGANMRQIAVHQERTNYNLAHRVITMGSWPLKTLKDEYNLPSSKLLSILPGANIQLKSNWTFPNLSLDPGINRELVLGFVGKDWERKGLQTLMFVKRELQARGFRVKLKIIGNCKAEWQNEAGVEFLGFIDKILNTERFIAEISSCDIGCLFSKGEALGISILEFLAVGVPVAGFYHQGMIDTLIPEASMQFELNAAIESIADRFQLFITDTNYQLSLKQSARNISSTVTWKSCISKWQKLFEDNI